MNRSDYLEVSLTWLGFFSRIQARNTKLLCIDHEEEGLKGHEEIHTRSIIKMATATDCFIPFVELRRQHFLSLVPATKH